MTNDYVKINRETLLLSGVALTELMTSVLDKKAPFRFTAPGFSMSPFIRHQDVITIATANEARYRLGEVVAFVNPRHGKLTVHRIVHVSRDGYLLKGDSNPEPDGRLPYSGIIGRVVQVEHHGRLFHLGLGRERIVIAWLSRIGWLTALLAWVWRVIKPVARNWMK